jgi:hypothetical protein
MYPIGMVNVPDILRKENLLGKVCRSSNGDLAVVCKQRIIAGTQSWEGIGFNGHFWRSRNPVIVANSIAEYINMVLSQDPKRREMETTFSLKTKEKETKSEEAIVDKLESSVIGLVFDINPKSISYESNK